MDYKMEERCRHEIDIAEMRCTRCGGSYWVVKNDPRPWPVIKKERESKKL